MVLKNKLSNKFGLIPIKQEDSIAFAEIVMYRALSCPQCTTVGKCIGTGEPDSGCKCEVNGLFATINSECDIGNWYPYTIDNFAEEWKIYKKLEGIEFKLDKKSKL